MKKGAKLYWYCRFIVLFSEIFFVYAKNPEHEVIVLTKPNSILLPKGKYEATFNEIHADTSLMKIFNHIKIKKIRKGMPNFKSDDTLKIGPFDNIVKLPDFSNLFVIEIESKELIDSAIILLKKSPLVIYAERNQKAVRRDVVNDPEFYRQWNLENEGEYGGIIGWDIDIINSWEITTGSPQTKVAVVDGGVDETHEDLNGNISGEPGYIEGDDHGTFIAGIIGALTNNNKGIAGINWNINIFDEKVDLTDITDVANGIIKATDNGAKIINCSWGYYGYSTTLFTAFLYDLQMGVMCVVAAPEDWSYGDYPNDFGPWIMNVSSFGNRGEVSYYVRAHPRRYIDIAAPGGNKRNLEEQKIFSTIPFAINSEGYGYQQGTSFAAPHVVGVAALLLSFNPNLKFYDLEWLLKFTAKDIIDNSFQPGAGYGWDEYTGYGGIKAHEALRRLLNPYKIIRGNASLVKTYENELWSFPNGPRAGIDPGTYICDVYKAEVTLSFQEPFLEPPIGWFSLTGYSGENPNPANEFLYINSSTQSITLMTFFYHIKWDLSGHPIDKWAPINPYLIPFKYTVLGPSSIHAPSNLHVVSVTETSLKLAWNDNSDNEMGFKIEARGGQYPDWTEIKTVGQNVTTTWIENLEFNTSYEFRVRAYAQEFYSEYSNTASATTSILNSPTNLSATSFYPYTFVNLTWQDNSNYEDGYEIWRRGINQNWHKINEVGANVTSYTDNSVSRFQDYFYKVRAKRGNVYSDFSDSIWVTTSPILGEGDVSYPFEDIFLMISRQTIQEELHF